MASVLFSLLLFSVAAVAAVGPTSLDSDITILINNDLQGECRRLRKSQC